MKALFLFLLLVCIFAAIGYLIKGIEGAMVFGGMIGGMMLIGALIGWAFNPLIEPFISLTEKRIERRTRRMHAKWQLENWFRKNH